MALIGGAVDFLVNFFEDIFGGGSTLEIPRQLLHKRHPLYPVILGFPNGEIPTEGSEGKPELCGDAEFCGVLPLQNGTAQNGQLCRQAAANHLRRCLEGPILVQGLATIPCDFALLGGPEAFEVCEEAVTILALPATGGGAGACYAQYRDEVRSCGQ